MGIIDKLPLVKAVVAWGLNKLPSEFENDKRVMTWKSFMGLG